MRAIARSPTDVQPVFGTIVGSAARVCEAEFSGVARFDDGLLHLVAVHSMSPEETAAFHSLFPRAPTRNFVMGRAFADAQPVHSEDVLTEPDYDTQTRDVLQSVVKYRSFLGVPILREGKPIGVIGCGRRAAAGAGAGDSRRGSRPPGGADAAGDQLPEVPDFSCKSLNKINIQYLTIQRSTFMLRLC